MNEGHLSLSPFRDELVKTASPSVVARQPSVSRGVTHASRRFRRRAARVHHARATTCFVPSATPGFLPLPSSIFLRIDSRFEIRKIHRYTFLIVREKIIGRIINRKVKATDEIFVSVRVHTGASVLLLGLFGNSETVNGSLYRYQVCR